MTSNPSPLSLLIVIPTLNSSNLLPRLLLSLQRQDWPHWRVLFIDGPSEVDHRRWLTECCNNEKRCSWVMQNPDLPGIYGAMNQGFSLAAPEDWVVFWGSDDWAASTQVFSRALSAIESARLMPDIVVCNGRYADATTDLLGRSTSFHPNCLLDIASYRRAVFLGFTPPHQATLFGPGVRSKLSYYAQGFRLSADLDYFLRLTREAELNVLSLDLEFVHMAEGGVSGQQTQRRLHEVFLAYRRAFGCFWWFPFVARYIRRFISLVSTFA